MRSGAKVWPTVKSVSSRARPEHRPEEAAPVEASVAGSPAVSEDSTGAGSTARRARPQHPACRGELGADVDDQGAHGDPRRPVVGHREVERPRVPEVDVREAGEQHEEPAADEGEQADPLDEVRGALERRPREELRVDGPQLGEQQRDRRDSRRDVETLGHPVEPGRSGREPEPAGRVLREVGEQAGREADRERHPERGARGSRRRARRAAGSGSCPRRNGARSTTAGSFIGPSRAKRPATVVPAFEHAEPGDACVSVERVDADVGPPEPGPDLVAGLEADLLDVGRLRRSRARRAGAPRAGAAIATRRSSVTGQPPMPTLPSSSRAVPHRPRRAPGRRWIARGPARRADAATSSAGGEMSMPSVTTPARASART